MEMLRTTTTLEHSGGHVEDDVSTTLPESDGNVEDDVCTTLEDLGGNVADDVSTTLPESDGNVEDDVYTTLQDSGRIFRQSYHTGRRDFGTSVECRPCENSKASFVQWSAAPKIHLSSGGAKINMDVR